MISLTHPFKDLLPDVDEAFISKNEYGIINTINDFYHRNKDLADKYYPTNTDANNEFTGDFFELFSEFLVKRNGGDNRIGIFNYSITEKNAPGVDGKGVGSNGFPATVQCKFRAPNYTLTDNDELTRFTSLSWGKYAVRVEDDMNMLIITTGAKVSPITLREMLLDKVRVLDYQKLRLMVDNVTELWIEFRESIKSSRGTKLEQIIPQSLRQHQIEAANSTDNCSKGKIILPTGTGKTRIESEIIRRTIVNALNNGEVPIIKINTSRILLCFQLFKDYYEYLTSHGINARYMNFNSGELDDAKFINYMRRTDGIARKVISTTSPDEVTAVYMECCKEKHPLIITSTYHSSKNCSKNGLVPHLTINDEAHNLVSLEFSDVTKLLTRKNIFLTATEDNSSNSNLGMNNVSLFGNYLYQKSPKQMIDIGEMVSPMIHIVEPADGQRYNLNMVDSDYKAILDSTYSAHDRHQEMIEQTSYDPSKIGAKLLIVSRNQTDLIAMAEYFDDYKKQRPDVHIFALSSLFGTYVDGERKKSTYNMDKHNLLESIKNLSPSSKAIIFHVDMIGEGIDVPAMTGVMPFRNSNIPKFVQNIGRSSRLHYLDRERFYRGEISVEDKSKWIKPHSWIILPNFLENTELFFERYRDIVIELRDNYGFNPSADKVIDVEGGLHDPLEIPPVNPLDGSSNYRDSGLEEFQHKLEEIEYQIEVERERLKTKAEFDELIKTAS